MFKHLQKLLLIAALCVPWATQAQGDTISTFPFSCDFETLADTVHWTFVNGSNAWYWGSATNNTTSGSNAIYITDNGGISNNYNGNSTSVSYAYITFEVTSAGQYGVQFDWKCDGESNYDFLRVAVASASTALPTSYSSWGTATVPTGFTAVDGGSKLNQSQVWSSQSSLLSITTPGIYRLIFVWRNDASVSYQPPAAIDNVVVAPVSCSSPTNLTLSDVTTESLTISWSHGSTESAWQVTNGIETDYTTDTFYTFSNLTANTAYNCGVRAICGSGDTSFYTLAQYRTSCAGISTLPWSNDFESENSGTSAGLPSCWTLINEAPQYNYYPYIYSYETYAHSGTKSLYCYSYYFVNYADVVLPELDTTVFPIRDVAFSFWAKKTSASYHPILIIGSIDNTLDPDSFVAFDTLDDAHGISTTYQKFTYTFDNYTGTNNRLVVRYMKTSATYYACLDDFMMYYNNHCDAPTNVTVVNSMDAESVELAWDGPGNEYELAVGYYGFNPDDEDLDYISVYDTTYTFTNLDDTLYQVYVRSICNSDHSIWSDPVLVYPGNYIMKSTGIDTIDGYCNYRIFDDGGPNGNYSVNCQSTLYILPPDEDHGFELSGTTWTQGSYDYLRITDIATGEVVFSDNTSNVNTQQSIAGVYIDGPTRILFHSDASTNYAGFDINVSCVELPDCPRPNNFALQTLTSDSVYLTWTGYEGTQWAIEYGATGFTRGDENDSTIGWANFNTSEGWVTGLNPGTVYDFYVMCICNNGDTSWTRAITLTTPCRPIPTDSLPYHYGFEDATTGTSGHINSCWWRYVGGSTTAYPYASGSYAAEGTKSLYFYGYSSNYYSYVTMPQFETPVSDLLVTFKLYKTSASYGSIEVGVMSNPNDLSTFTSVGVFQPSDISTWESFKCNLGRYTGTGNFIAFVQRSSYYTYLDDITVMIRPDCPEATNVAMGDITTSSAYVSWNDESGYSSSPSTYMLTLTDENNHDTVMYHSDKYIILTNLTPNTDYTLSVQSICGNDTMDAASVDFSTKGFGCIAVDPTTAFSDTIGNGTTTNSYLPSYSFYNYGYSQQIYTAQEIGTGGQINTITVFPANVTQQRTYEIYLGHVTESAATSFLSPSDLTLVYNGGAVTMTAGQPLTFNLTTPFNYNGSDNLLVVFRDMTGSYVSGNTFYVHSSTSNVSRYVYQDPSPYTPGAVTGGTALSVKNNIIISGSECAVTATCADPLAQIINVTSTTVDIVWAPGASESAWNVRHKAADDSVWTTDLTNTTLNSYTFTNLDPNTEYEFMVYFNCDTNVYSKTVTAVTPCLPVSVPFFENFATWTAGYGAWYTPECWIKTSTYPYDYPYVTSSTVAMSGGKYLYFYTPSGYNTWVALPKFADPVDTLALTFYTYYSTADYSMRVGVMSDNNDYSTFQTVETITHTMAGQWEGHEVLFTGMDDGYIALTGPLGGYTYLYIDNITVDYMNPCLRPTNVTQTMVTTSSMTISWQDAATTNFEVEYGPRGFSQGTGTIVPVVGSSNLTLTNLTQGTYYDIYVRGICGAGDTSEWSFCKSLATDCATISSLPFFENFNNSGSGTGVHAPICWGYGSDYSVTYPYIYSYYNHSGTTGGSMYMYIYDYSGYGYSTWFNTPTIDTNAVSSLNQVQAVFYTYASSTAYVMVGVNNSEDNIDDFTPVDTIMVPSGVWTEWEIPLSSYTGNGRRVAFVSKTEGINGANYYQYPCIDDVTIERIPTCPRPNQLASSNPTTNSVELSWNDRAGASQWIIEYGPIGFQPGTGIQVAANSNPFTLNGVTLTQGEFYVKAICSSSDTGDYSRYPGEFMLNQIPATIPYSYNFEDGAEWNNWQRSTNNSQVNWYRGTAVAGEGEYSVYVSRDNGNTYIPYTNDAVVNAAVWRDVDFGTVDSSYIISFLARAGGTIERNYDGLMVFVVDDSLPTVASSSNITSPWGNVNDLYTITVTRRDTNWQVYQGSIDTLHGVKRVAFFWFNQNTSTYDAYLEPAAVDSLTIDYATCVRPTNVTASNITTSSATLSWQGASNAQYEVVYRPYGAPTSDNIMVTANTNSVTLSGLHNLTSYSVWVRKACGEGDYSLYSDGYRFRTEFCAAPDTVRFDYDSSSTTGTTYIYPINNYYNYTLSEIIIDSAELGDITLIDAIGLYYDYNIENSTKSNVNIYIMKTDKTEFISTTDFVNLDNTAVLVYSGDLICTEQGWNLFGFSTPYIWDGEGNLMVIFDDNSGSYNSSTYVWRNRSTSEYKTIVSYSDSYNADPTNILTSGVNVRYQYRPEMMLFSCGLVCGTPGPLSATNIEYNSATLNWGGNADIYQVSYKVANDPSYTEDIMVYNNYLDIENLQPLTTYQYRVRSVCPTDEDTLYSDWVTASFTTDTLPCFAPSALQNTAVDLTTATFDWNVNGEETTWRLYVWNSTFNQSYDITAHPTTVTGLTQTTDYYATVVALCGANLTESETSDTISFTTATCQPVSNVAVSDVSQNAATVSWSGSAASYTIEYGQGDFETGNGTLVSNITTTSYEITGLTADRNYSVYVRADCDAQNPSAWSERVQFRTLEVGIADVNGVNMTVHPNPTSDNTTIALSGVSGDVTITIVDLNGRTVKSDSMSCDGDCVKTLVVSGLAEGTYFVRVSGEGINMVKKLVVK